MPLHKFSGAFFKDMQVEWPCPECGQKTLEIIQETFFVNDTHDTNKHSREDWFEPEMHRAIFSCTARCSRRQCGEIVACSGDSGWSGEDGTIRMMMKNITSGFTLKPFSLHYILLNYRPSARGNNQSSIGFFFYISYATKRCRQPYQNLSGKDADSNGGARA